jgi:hypothetical protein
MALLDEFSIVIRRDAGSFVARIPELDIESRGVSIDDTIDRLDKLYQTKTPTPMPSRGNAVAAPRSDIRRFAIKAGIVTAMIVFGGLILSFQLAAVLDNAVYSLQHGFSHVGGSQFWGKFDTELARAADPKNDMPTERKQQMLANIHTLVDRWQPFIAEAQRAFSTPAPQALAVQKNSAP